MKRFLSFLMVMLFSFGLHAASTWTVAGAPEGLFGASWSPSTAANDMTLVGGLYKWTKEDVTLSKGNFQFKVCADHAWGEAYPGDNKVVDIDEDGKYDVEITFNADTKEVTATATKKGSVVIDHSYTVVGGSVALFGTAWAPALEDNDLTQVDAIYKWTKEDVTLSAGTIEYKIVQDHAWGTEWPSSGNFEYEITKAGKYNVTVTFDGENTVTFVAEEQEEPTPIKYYIIGSGDPFGNWSFVPVYKDTFEIKDLAAGDYMFRIAFEENNWDNCKGFSNLTETPAGLSGGDYNNILFTYKETADFKVVYNSTEFKVIGNFAPQCVDGPYAVLVNGAKEVEMKASSTANEYIAYLSLAKGDNIQLLNKSCGATWIADIESYDAGAHFDQKENLATVDSTGCYDLYFKNDPVGEADGIYIGYGICPGDTIYPEKSYVYYENSDKVQFTVKNGDATVESGFDKILEGTKLYVKAESKKYDYIIKSVHAYKGENKNDTVYIVNDTLVMPAADLHIEVKLGFHEAKIAGVNGSWAGELLKTAEDGKSATVTLNLPFGPKTFKMVIDGNWLGDGEAFVRKDAEKKMTTIDGDANATLDVDIKGDYTFTWNFADSTLKVTYPAAPEEVTLYFVNAKGWEAVYAYVFEDTIGAKAWPGEAMTKTAEQVWEKDIYSVKVLSSYSDIIFTNGEDKTGTYAWNKNEPYYCEGYWYEKKADIPEIEPAKYYLTGNEALVAYAGLLPESAWSKAIKVTKDAFEFKNLAAGYYKLRVINTKDEWIGYSKLSEQTKGLHVDTDDNICFTMTEAGDVTVLYKETATDTIFTVKGDYESATVVALAGEFNGWSANANLFKMAEGGLTATLTMNLEAEVDSFKIVSDGNWLSLNGGGETSYEINRLNPQVAGLKADQRNLVLNADVKGDYTFTWTYADSTLAVTYPELPADDSYYAVAGNSLALFYHMWRPDHDFNYTQLKQQANGLFKWDREGVVLPQGEVRFKICKDKSFDESWPAEDYVLAIPENGEYTVTILFNAVSHQIIATAEKTGNATFHDPIDLKGSWDNWAEDHRCIIDEENKKALITMNLTAGNYEFKFHSGDLWFGNDQEFTRANSSIRNISELGGGNMILHADVDGDYIFTWVFEENHAMIQFPSLVPVKKISRLEGEFSVSATEKVNFSRGNLQYNFGEKAWYTAETQYEVLGDANLRIGDDTYKGSIDLFSWSCASSNYGILPSALDADFTGDFKDWGELFAGGEDTWRTLNLTEFKYLLDRKKDGHVLWTCVALGPDSVIGLALFPDDWTVPEGLTVSKYGFAKNDDAAALKKTNYYSFEQWAQMEAAGAVVLPAGGARAGTWNNYVYNGKDSNPDMINPLTGSYCWISYTYNTGYYWLGEDPNYFIYGENAWGNTVPYGPRERRRGHNIRLVTAAKAPVYTVVGDSMVFGRDWNTDLAANNMVAYNGDTLQLALKNVTLPANTYGYKIVKNHDWKYNYPEGDNAELKITQNGIYDLLFLFDTDSKKDSVIPTLIKKIMPIVAIGCDMNGWSETANTLKVAEDEKTASDTLHFTAAGNYPFKLIINGSWMTINKGSEEESNFTLHRGYPGSRGVVPDKGPEDPAVMLKVDKAGDYIFTWTYDNDSIGVTFPALMTSKVKIEAPEHGKITVMNGETAVVSDATIQELTKLKVSCESKDEENYQVLNLRAFKTEDNTPVEIGEDGYLTMPGFGITIKADEAFKPQDATLKIVPGVWATEDAKIAVYTWAGKGEAAWSKFFAPISAGNDTLSAVINGKADSLVVVRFKSTVEAPTWTDEDKNITHKIDNQEIDHAGLTLTITDWDKAQWDPYVYCPFESWFTSIYNWDGETESKLVYNPEDGSAVVTIAMDKNAQWKAQAKYQGPEVKAGKYYDVSLKLHANRNLGGVTIKYQDDKQMFFEDQSVSLEAEKTHSFAWKNLYGIGDGNGKLVLDFGYALAGTVITISDIQIVEKDAGEYRLADGFYLIGPKSWSVDDLQATDLFAAGGTEGEYELATALAENDKLEVVKVEKDTIRQWYPGGGNDYVVTAKDAGEVTIYFREKGNTEWEAFGGYMWIEKNSLFTVSELLEYVGESDSRANKTVTGNVSAIVTAYSTKWKNITFDFSDTGNTAEAQLRAYRAKGDEAENIAVGDKVVVSGDYVYFNHSVKELTEACQIISRIAIDREHPTLVVSGEPEITTYAEGQTFKTNGLKVEATYNTGYKEDVTAEVTWHTNLADDVVMTAGTVQVWATFAESTSNTIEVAVKVAEQAPEFSPEPGLYLEPKMIEISAAPGATIYYTIDGSEPSAASKVYSEPFELGERKVYTVKAIAYSGAHGLSQVVSAEYDIRLPFTVAEAIDFIGDNTTGIADQYVEALVCQIDKLESGRLTYWISDNGKTDEKLEAYRGYNLNGEAFSSTEDLKIGDLVLVKGTLKKYKTFYEFDQNNVLIRHKVAEPSILTISGTPDLLKYAAGQTFDPTGLNVTALHTTGYELDVTSEAVFTTNLPENKVTEAGTVKVWATWNELTNEEPYEVAVSIAEQAPMFNIPGGEYTTDLAIMLTAAEGATIYYTLDGTDPSAASKVYSQSIVLDKRGTTTIKAIAIRGTSESQIVSATYTINLPYNSLAELVADDPAIGTHVSVAIDNYITYIISNRTGVYLDAKDKTGETDVEIYFNGHACGTSWKKGDHVKGQVVGTWDYYENESTNEHIWEIKPDGDWDWSYLTLTSYSKVYFDTPENGTLEILNGEAAINYGDAFAQGTKLTVKITPNAGYTGEVKVINGENDVTEEVYAEGQLTVPNYNVKVIATFKEKEPENVTLYFVNKPFWEEVHYYVWKDGIGDEAAWPGKAMTLTDKTLEDKATSKMYQVYSCTFPETYNKIIFNNGQGGGENQTSDMSWDVATPYYYDGIWYATLEEIDTEAKATFYISGDGALVGQGSVWDPKAIKSLEDSYVLSLTAGTYQLKISLDGTVATWKGYNDLTSKADGLNPALTDPNAIEFVLATAGNVVVTYKVENEEVTFKLEGNFYYLEDGYYLAGQEKWDIFTLDEQVKFEPNDMNPGEYVLPILLAKDDKIQAVKVENNRIYWYGTTYYTVDDAHAGNAQVFFKPEYQEEWAAFGGYIYVHVEGGGSGMDEIEASEKAVKIMKNGQFYIIKNGKMYNGQGQLIR